MSVSRVYDPLVDTLSFNSCGKIIVKSILMWCENYELVHEEKGAIWEKREMVYKALGFCYDHLVPSIVCKWEVTNIQNDSLIFLFYLLSENEQGNKLINKMGIFEEIRTSNKHTKCFAIIQDTYY